MNITNDTKIGVIGSGAMGSGIAQVAAMAGHPVVIYDTNPAALDKSETGLTSVLNKLQEKGKLKDATEVLNRFSFVSDMNAFADCGLVIEAIIENLEVKKSVFSS